MPRMSFRYLLIIYSMDFVRFRLEFRVGLTLNICPAPGEERKGSKSTTLAFVYLKVKRMLGCWSSFVDFFDLYFFSRDLK